MPSRGYHMTTTCAERNGSAQVDCQAGCGELSLDCPGLVFTSLVMNTTALIGILFMMGIFCNVKTAELQWSSRVQHGRDFSCPGERVVFTCTLNDDTHDWTITQQSNLSNSFVVPITPRALMSGITSPDPLYSFGGFQNGSVIVSTATVVATPSIGTINVRCQRTTITNNATDVQSVQAEFMDATWSFSANDPSSERPLSDLSVNVSMDERGRQCVDSFIITDNNDASLNCTGDRNATTITCPPQNFCKQNMYSLRGSTTPFSIPSSQLRMYNATFPSDVISDLVINPSHTYNENGLEITAMWQVIDDRALNSGSLMVNASLMEVPNTMVVEFNGTNSARLTFNITSLRAEDPYEVEVSIRPRGQECNMVTNNSNITVRNAIRVENISSESYVVTVNSDFHSELRGAMVSISLSCDAPVPMPTTRPLPASGPVNITLEPTSPNCNFTVKLLLNDRTIGFPITRSLMNEGTVIPSTEPSSSTSMQALPPGAIAGIVVAIVILLIIIIIICAVICWCYVCKDKKSEDTDMVELKRGSHPSDAPASNNAPPEGDFYTEVSSSRDTKTDRPEDHLPTYQAPDTIKREAVGGTGGDVYTVVDKPKKGGKKANDKSEDEVAQLYAMPDKSKKKQNQDQGLVYADIQAGGQPVRHPAPAPQRGNTFQQDTGSVTYSTVNVANV